METRGLEWILRVTNFDGPGWPGSASEDALLCTSGHYLEKPNADPVSYKWASLWPHIPNPGEAVAVNDDAPPHVQSIRLMDIETVSVPKSRIIRRPRAWRHPDANRSEMSNHSVSLLPHAQCEAVNRLRGTIHREAVVWACCDMSPSRCPQVTPPKHPVELGRGGPGLLRVG